MMIKHVCDKNFNVLWEVFAVSINCAETLASQWQGAFGFWDERLLPSHVLNFPI